MSGYDARGMALYNGHGPRSILKKWKDRLPVPPDYRSSTLKSEYLNGPQRELSADRSPLLDFPPSTILFQEDDEDHNISSQSGIPRKLQRLSFGHKH